MNRYQSDYQPEIHYYIGNEFSWDDVDPGGYYPPVGSGVVDPRGNRYRVADLWIVYEKHSRMDRGPVHVKLEPASDSEDWPAQLHPDYFKP